MTIILTNDIGCLIDEKNYDVDTATEAMQRYMEENPIFEVGDRIQIKD